MYAREQEFAVYQRCADVAAGRAGAARDAQEANVLRVASMLFSASHPQQAKRLAAVSGAYFAMHPTEVMDTSQVVEHGLIPGLQQMQDRLAPLLV